MPLCRKYYKIKTELYHRDKTLDFAGSDLTYQQVKDQEDNVHQKIR